MKIECNCGHTIVDQTDYLKFKAHIISDKQYFDFWQGIDAAVEHSGSSTKEKEEAVMKLRNQFVFQLAWECSNCGKLYIDGKNGDVFTYIPASNQYNEILNYIS